MGGRHPHLGRRVDAHHRKQPWRAGTLGRCRLSAGVNPRRGHHGAADGLGQSAQYRVGQYRGDKRAAHRQQESRRADLDLRCRQRRHRRAGRARGSPRRCGATGGTHGLYRPLLSGLARFQGRQGGGDLSGHPAGLGLADGPCGLRHLARRGGDHALFVTGCTGRGRLDSGGDGLCRLWCGYRSGRLPWPADLCAPLGQYRATARGDRRQDRGEIPPSSEPKYPRRRQQARSAQP